MWLGGLIVIAVWVLHKALVGSSSNGGGANVR